MNDIVPVKSLPVANTLGEAVLWNTGDESVWWTDIQQRLLFRYHLTRSELKKWPLPDRLASFAFTDRPGWLVCAFAEGLAFYNPDANRIHWVARPESHMPHTRFNDGKIDRQGRFWAGTMVESGDERVERGSLYCLDETGVCTRKESGLYIPNALCWSPAGDRMYCADSPTRAIYQYCFDGASAAMHDKKVFATTPDGMTPDGATVDAEGCVWNAHWDGGRIVRYAPNGRIIRTLTLPCPRPTCCCFGGPDMRYLFVTSAREGLDTNTLSEQPEAGNLFIFRTVYTGLAETKFAMPVLS